MSEPTLSEIKKKLDLLLKHVKNIEEHLGIALPDATPKKTNNSVGEENATLLKP